MKVKRPASPRVVNRSSGKPGSSKAVVPFKLPENDDDGPFRVRKGKPRSKETDAKIREMFEQDMQALEDADEKKVKSVFKKDFEAIKRKLSPDSDISVEDSAAAFYRTSVALIYDLMPTAEENYRLTKKEGAAYVISTLINQARDLNNDLRLMEDVEGKVRVIDDLITAMFVRIVELLVREIRFNMSTNVDSLTTDATIRKAVRKQMEDSLKSYSIGLQDFQTILKQQVRLFMQGDPNYLNPTKANEEAAKPKSKKGKKKRTA